MYNTLKDHVVQLARFWRDSLALISPFANLILFVKAILNNIRRTYKTLGMEKIGFFLVLGIFIYWSACSRVHFNELPALAKVRFSFYSAFLLCTCIQAMRPSINRKDGEYFILIKGGWYNYAIVLMGVFIAYLYSSHEMIQQKINIMFNLNDYTSWAITSLKVWQMLCMPYIITGLLFWFDGPATLKEFLLSWYRALRMLFLNLPLYCIIAIVQLIFFNITFMGIRQVIVLLEGYAFSFLCISVIFAIFPLIIVPWLIAPLIVVYTKKVYDHHRLYFL